LGISNAKWDIAVLVKDNWERACQHVWT